MKKTKKNTSGQSKGVMSKINNDTVQKEKVVSTDKEKGVIAKMNDKTDQKK